MARMRYPDSDHEDPYDRDEDSRTLVTSSREATTELVNPKIGTLGTLREAAKRKPGTQASDLKSESSCPMHSDEECSSSQKSHGAGEPYKVD